MATYQSVFALAQAALDSDRPRIVSVCQQIVASEPQNSSLRASLSRLLARTPHMAAWPDDVPPEIKGLVMPVDPVMTLAQVVLDAPVQRSVTEFIQERRHDQALRDVGLAAPHKIMLSGPPGNGKTTLAGAIAKELGLPFFVVDFSQVISSYLGESGSKIAKVFRAVAQRPAVLFLDEMETVLPERAGGAGSSSDLGEMKRMVSTVLLEIDRLPDNVVLIGATNHEEMLDRAVVRRFDHHWNLTVPSQAVADAWLHAFAKRYPAIPVLARMPRTLIDEAQSLSDKERAALRWCRRWMLESVQAQEGGGAEAGLDKCANPGNGGQDCLQTSQGALQC